MGVRADADVRRTAFELHSGIVACVRCVYNLVYKIVIRDRYSPIYSVVNHDRSDSDALPHGPGTSPASTVTHQTNSNAPPSNA